MKAIRIESHGGAEALQLLDVPIPEPAPGEIRVRMEAIALNHLDLWVRRGVPGHKFPLPLVPVSDGAGVIDALGPGVRAFTPGQAVVLTPGVSCGHCEACQRGLQPYCRNYAILGEARDGLAAELVCVPAANVRARDPAQSLEEAASYSLTFQTAWNMLVRRARVEPGETVLIHAAGSGVGVAAVQIAKLLGARVFATAGTEEKCRRAEALGADAAICYRKEDFVREVKRLTDGKGVEVCLDHVGAETFAQSIRALAWAGRLVTCGATTGPKVELHLNALFFKSLSLLGSTMGSNGDLHRIQTLVERGRLSPVVGQVLEGLDAVAEGHRLLEAREVFGKLVIRL